MDFTLTIKLTNVMNVISPVKLVTDHPNTTA